MGWEEEENFNFLEQDLEQDLEQALDQDLCQDLALPDPENERDFYDDFEHFPAGDTADHPASGPSAGREPAQSGKSRGPKQGSGLDPGHQPDSAGSHGPNHNKTSRIGAVDIVWSDSPAGPPKSYESAPRDTNMARGRLTRLRDAVAVAREDRGRADQSTDQPRAPLALVGRSPAAIGPVALESSQRVFTSAIFRCYIRDLRHNPDGEMQLILRIPNLDALEGMKLAFAFQEILNCEITSRKVK